jgi:phytoene desaturase
LTQQSVKNNIIFKVSFCKDDFVKDYNSYKGIARNGKYIVANRVPEAKIKSKKKGNLYFTGQLTVPGPGVPPALISGKLVSDLINKQFLEI